MIHMAYTECISLVMVHRTLCGATSVFTPTAVLEAKQEGFGVLRVMNDDLVQPGSGFGDCFTREMHTDAELVTYIVEGSLTHQDSIGKVADGETSVRLHCRFVLPRFHLI